MKVVFLGTPDYVVPILELVHKRFSRRGISPIEAVVTQPPRPTGRKQLRQFSPVDTWAFKKRVPIFHGSRELIASQTGADIGILASYGEIIPEAVINYFPFGILNIHPSLLPRWRGASPIPATILSGDKTTGVSIIKLDPELDHGPIVSQFKEEVNETDTAETLRNRLFERSAEVVVQLLEPFLERKITPREQKHKEATITTQMKKEHAFIPPKYLKAATSGNPLKEDWKVGFVKDFLITPTPETVDRFIRAMDPWPGAWTFIKLGKGKNALSRRLKILKAHLEQSLVIDLVQMEGKEPVSWKQFSAGYKEAAFAEE